MLLQLDLLQAILLQSVLHLPAFLLVSGLLQLVLLQVEVCLPLQPTLLHLQVLLEPNQQSNHFPISKMAHQVIPVLEVFLQNQDLLDLKLIDLPLSLLTDLHLIVEIVLRWLH